jgi:hypothetical protein
MPGGPHSSRSVLVKCDRSAISSSGSPEHRFSYLKWIPRTEETRLPKPQANCVVGQIYHYYRVCLNFPGRQAQGSLEPGLIPNRHKSCVDLVDQNHDG